jgi:hypothetical protein
VERKGNTKGPPAQFLSPKNQAAAVFMPNIPMGKGIKPAQNT